MVSIVVLCPVMVGLTCGARWLQVRDQRVRGEKEEEERLDGRSGKEGGEAGEGRGNEA